LKFCTFIYCIYVDLWKQLLNELSFVSFEQNMEKYMLKVWICKRFQINMFFFTYFIMKSYHGWLVKALVYPCHEDQSSIHATNIRYVHIVCVCVCVCIILYYIILYYTIHKFHILKTWSIYKYDNNYKYKCN